MNTSEIKQCQSCQQNFTIESDDFDFYKKIDVPPPTWCPECRFRRRLSFMNMRCLYRRKCDKCNKSIIAMYPEDSHLTVFCNNCYWGDSWNGTDFGRKYDPSRPFISQLIELRNSTPFMALEANYPMLINTEYANYVSTQKNCYMTIMGDYGENLLYCDFFVELKDSSDCFRMTKSELSYESIGCNKCYGVKWSEDLQNCSNMFFSSDCVGCSDCFGCVGLRNKKYCMWNSQLTKSEYEKNISEMQFCSRKFVEDMREKSLVFWAKFPHRATKNDSLSKDVIGEGIYESKNAKHCYIGIGIEDSKYVALINMPKVKDSYDYTEWGNGAEKMYEVAVSGEKSSDVMFSNECWPEVYDIQYSMYTLSSSKHCFGCVNLKKKEYCILNREYPKEEYDALKKKIVNEMNENPFVDKKGRIYKYGEFLPYEMSPFAYNQTIANDFFPNSESQAKEDGFTWYNSVPNEYKITKNASDLPDSINDISEDISKEIIACSLCGNAYRIIPQELSMLKKLCVPIPSQCPSCRYKYRFSRQNPPKFFQRRCAKCEKDMLSSYAPERPEIVYCEGCYQKEVA